MASSLISKGFMAPQVGLEPTTLRLTAECSAIELLRNIGGAQNLSNARTDLITKRSEHGQGNSGFGGILILECGDLSPLWLAAA